MTCFLHNKVAHGIFYTHRQKKFRLGKIHCKIFRDTYSKISCQKKNIANILSITYAHVLTEVPCNISTIHNIGIEYGVWNLELRKIQLWFFLRDCCSFLFQRIVIQTWKSRYCFTVHLPKDLWTDKVALHGTTRRVIYIYIYRINICNDPMHTHLCLKV